jgi:hypothetical protein
MGLEAYEFIKLLSGIEFALPLMESISGSYDLEGNENEN